MDDEESQDAAIRRTQSLRYPHSACSPSTQRQSRSSRNNNDTVRKLSGSTSRSGLRLDVVVDQLPPRCITPTTFSRLSAPQKSTIRASWKCLRSNQWSLLHATLKRTFNQLETQNAIVKQMFYKSTIVDCFNRGGASGGNEQTANNINSCHSTTGDASPSSSTIATVDDHVRELIRLFDELITHDQLDEPQKMADCIRQIGADHARLKTSCKFGSVLFEKWGEIAIERLCALDAVQKPRDGAKAWCTLIACIIDELRSGFDSEVRAVSRKSSMVSSCADDNSSGGGDGLSSNNTCTIPAALDQRMKKLRLEQNSSTPF